MEASAGVSVVQFPHPGGEKRLPRPGVFPWTSKNHGRKFMTAPAVWRQKPTSGDQTGEVTFWGEWEALSRVEEVWPREGALPSALHRPLVTLPEPGRRENTDPWVFGDCFRYSNCKQLLNGRPSGLQSLRVGSVVLFGSAVGGQFVLDTVLVVGEATTATLDEHLDTESDPLFRRNVWESLCTDSENGAGWLRTATFTLFRGATAENPIDGMFSFVPALPGGRARFRRPPIVTPRGIDRQVVNPRNVQAQKGFKPDDRMPLSLASAIWRDVAAQVEAHGLVLAHQVHNPQDATTQGLGHDS